MNLIKNILLPQRLKNLKKFEIAIGVMRVKLKRKHNIVENQLRSQKQNNKTNMKIIITEQQRKFITEIIKLDIKVGDVEEEDEEAAAIRHLEEIRAKKAQKALANQLPELVNAFVAERELELDALKVKADEINKKIADAKAGLFNEELIAKAAGKLVKPTKTKSGKKVIPLKSGEIRAEAVMGKGAMRDAKLKSLVRTKGEGIRWVSKGSKGVEYGIYKDIICSRHNGEFSMPIWADLVKELKFEKGMTIALFKQQLTTQ